MAFAKRSPKTCGFFCPLRSCGVRRLNPSCFFQGTSLATEPRQAPEGDVPGFALIPLHLQALAKRTAMGSAAVGKR